jgi:hypothetical protein
MKITIASLVTIDVDMDMMLDGSITNAEELLQNAEIIETATTVLDENCEEILEGDERMKLAESIIEILNKEEA